MTVFLICCYQFTIDIQVTITINHHWQWEIYCQWNNLSYLRANRHSITITWAKLNSYTVFKNSKHHVI